MERPERMSSGEAMRCTAVHTSDSRKIGSA